MQPRGGRKSRRVETDSICDLLGPVAEAQEEKELEPLLFERFRAAVWPGFRRPVIFSGTVDGTEGENFELARPILRCGIDRWEDKARWRLEAARWISMILDGNLGTYGWDLAMKISVLEVLGMAIGDGVAQDGNKSSLHRLRVVRFCRRPRDVLSCLTASVQRNDLLFEENEPEGHMLFHHILARWLSGISRGVALIMHENSSQWRDGLTRARQHLCKYRRHDLERKHITPNMMSS